MRVTVLGCGSSSGVPMIGCICAVCASDNPKNKRLRVSLFIETNGMNLLVDSSPDLRQQALRAPINRVDAVLYTHAHADHINGLADLRAFNIMTGATLPVYGDTATLTSLTQAFPYAFDTTPQPVWYRPSLTPNILPEHPICDFTVGKASVRAFKQKHGHHASLGYRIGDFAYSTDTDGLEETAFEALAGVKLWVVDCLGYKESHGHSHLENTLKWIGRVKPDLAVLTHMSHFLEYEALAAQLPPGVVPAYDGMTLDLP